MGTHIIMILPKNLHQSRRGAARARKINKIYTNADGVDKRHTDTRSVTIQKDAAVKNGAVIRVKTVINTNTLNPFVLYPSDGRTIIIDYLLWVVFLL